MFYFLFLFLASLTLIFASPIPDDSDNSDLDRDTVSFNSNTGSGNGDDLDSSILLSNEVIVANPAVNVIEPLCESETSIDKFGETGNNIQKRSNVCLPHSQGKASLQALPQQSIYQPRKSTSTSNNPCDRKKPHYVSCGGPEVPDNNSFITDLFRSVLNCVPAVKRRIEARPPKFIMTDLTAEYCCETFDDKGPFYAGVICQKMTPLIDIVSITPAELYRQIEEVLEATGRNQKATQIREWVEEFRRQLFRNP